MLKMAKKLATSLELQLVEMEALTATFSSDEFGMVLQERGPVHILQGIAESGGANMKATDVTQPTFEYTLQLACNDATGACQKVVVNVRTPRAYPDRALPDVRVRAEGFTRENERSFNELLGSALPEFAQSKEGVVFDVIEFVREEVSPFLTQAESIDGKAAKEAGKGNEVSEGVIRGFIGFHHMLYGKEHKKEQKVVALAKDLCLSGFIVYGKPSLICIETDSVAEVEEFVQEAKRCGKSGDITYIQEVADKTRKCNRGKPGLQQIQALGKGGETPDTHALIEQLTALGLKDKRKEITGRK